MLVLSRVLGGKIHVRHPGLPGGEMIITVVEIDRGKVRLGFEADRDVVIMRSELLDSQPPKKEP